MGRGKMVPARAFRIVRLSRHFVYITGVVVVQNRNSGDWTRRRSVLLFVNRQ